MSGPLDGAAGTRFLALQRTFRSSIFRLETLQVYGGSGEDEAIRRFRDGRPPPALDDGDRAYLNAVRSARARDAGWQRVHVVREPLSEYLRFELTWAYAPNVAAGEEIGLVVLPTGASWPVGVGRQAFWLVDDRQLFVPDYDPSGLWLGFDEVDDRREIEQARRAKACALRASEPWHRYVARCPDLAAEVARLGP